MMDKATPITFGGTFKEMWGVWKQLLGPTLLLYTVYQLVAWGLEYALPYRWLATILTIFIFPFVGGTMCLWASAVWQGRYMSWGETWMELQKRPYRILFSQILLYLAIFIGSLALVVPGLIIFVNSAVMLPALLNEDLGIWASWKRSIDLVRGLRWRILGYLLLLTLFFLVLGVLGYLLGIHNILNRVIGALFGGWTPIFATVLYFKLKARQVTPVFDCWVVSE